MKSGLAKFAPALAAAAAILAGAGGVQAQTVVKHIQSDKSFIAAGVWAGDTYYLSGQLADPITPADPAKNTPAVYATDTATQAASVFAKIKAALQEQGLDMKDVVKLTVFLGPDPKDGKARFQRHERRIYEIFRHARSAQQAGPLRLPGGRPRRALGAPGGRGHRCA